MPFSIKEVDFTAKSLGPLWLDNSRVLFSGHSKEEGPPTGLAHRYYVWDIDRATLTREAHFDEASRPCVHGDYLMYSVQTPDGKRKKRLAFFKGQPVEVSQEEGIWFNPISCRPSATQPPPWIVNGHTTTSKIPLLEEHGYIDRGTDGQDQIEEFPLLYYRSGVARPISLGLTSRHTEPHVSYMPFFDAYLIEGARGRLTAPPLWLLHPDGKVEQIFSPEGKAWATQTWQWVVVTKRGLVFGKVTYRGDQVRDSGLYLWESGTLTKLLSGVVSGGAAVSPDGCKLAYIFNRIERPLPSEELFRLQIVDLCQGGTNVH
ncbi:MAG TPA: hypothetical protein VJ746_14295 [Nitrospira sp.]|nr:hypothetical protein [Nitrospira sp.]